MPEKADYGALLDKSLRVFFWDAVRASVTEPRQALFFLRTVLWQTRAARTRRQWEARGVKVPPILIASVTHRCNLACAGCYDRAVRAHGDDELSEAKLRSVVHEAQQLGISFVVIAGGEPLVRTELLAITRDFPKTIFMIFTNGLLLDDERVSALKRQGNTFPILSLEGCETETDERRGRGVYQRLQEAMRRLNDSGVFFGVSLTATRSNFTVLTEDSFINDLTRAGCKLFFFVEYTPVNEQTEDWVITDEQRGELPNLVQGFRSKYRALFISVPGDEEEFGGCLSAGRGFVHVSPDGNLEPCPFIAYSDTNLKDMSLKEALSSHFLKAIRDNHPTLHEESGGCVLWKERDKLATMLKASG